MGAPENAAAASYVAFSLVDGATDGQVLLSALYALYASMRQRLRTGSPFRSVDRLR